MRSAKCNGRELKLPSSETLIAARVRARMLLPTLHLQPLTYQPRFIVSACASDDIDWRGAARDLLESREWPCVDSAVAAAVAGESALPGDDHAAPARKIKQPSPSAQRVTWKLNIAYHGPSFSGFAWQSAASKATVEGCLQDAIRPLTDGKSQLQLSCAGRTDAGVSALGQLVSFHAWPTIKEEALSEAIAHASPVPGALRLINARRITRSNYHATHSTTWRRYAYILPPLPTQTADDIANEASRLDELLQPLSGTTRCYAALGRSVPEGKETRMLLRHASARLVDV